MTLFEGVGRLTSNKPFLVLLPPPRRLCFHRHLFAC